MMGSGSALTAEMRKHRVGGAGRWHIMHLPKGSSMLQTSDSKLGGDRRNTFSALQQLRHGQVLSTPFPPYNGNLQYKHPLSKSHVELEINTAKSLTPESVQDYLKRFIEFPTRSYMNEEASSTVANWLEKEFKRLGFITCKQHFQGGGKHQENVIAHVPGSSSDTITVAAHYDSRPFVGPAPGAEDNGSGVATLLAIANAYKKHIHFKPKKGIYFAAFAGQEPGLMGSKEFVSFLENGGSDMPETCRTSASFLRVEKRAPSDHRALILDEIGWKSPQFSQFTVNLESYDSSKEMMDHLRHSSAMHNGWHGLEVIHNKLPFGSDHMAFLEKKMMSVLSINADDESYPHYHRNTDTIENLSPLLMAMVGKMNLGALLRMVL